MENGISLVYLNYNLCEVREQLAGTKEANKEMLWQHGSLMSLVVNFEEYNVIANAGDKLKEHEELLCKLCARLWPMRRKRT